ncbi:MAG: hypothetical protein NC394_10205 [Bacteroides sp.]|nr:hypothetical protein [Bacteroides sp.]
MAEYEKSLSQCDLNSAEKNLNGTEKQISEVEASLYKKAVGGTVTETVKRIGNGRVHVETRVKQLPPDQRAIEYFLNNRAADKWSGSPKGDDGRNDGKLAELMEGLKE